MRQIPIYLISGFLESGKTCFLRDVLEGGDFDDGQKGLLILCEEGEEEYDETVLEEMNIEVITVDDEEEFDSDFLQKCVKQYNPKRVFMETNGVWDNKWMFEQPLPAGLVIAQVITVVDGSTFAVYLNNMRSILSNLFLYTEMVIFNRCTEEMDLQSYRRTVRGLNPRAMVYFEDEEGEPIDPGMDIPPYDLNAEIIQIEDVDYGLWYLDAQEHPERYVGKEIRFNARYCESSDPAMKHFVPGRHIMTCCEDDIEFLGFLCNYTQDISYEHGEWIKVAVKFDYGP